MKNILQSAKKDLLRAETACRLCSGDYNYYIVQLRQCNTVLPRAPVQILLSQSRLEKISIQAAPADRRPRTTIAAK